MKKIKQTVFMWAAAFSMWPGLCSFAYSDESITIDVVLTIQSVNVEGIISQVNVSAPPASSRLSSRAIVKNPNVSGSGNEDFSIRIASQTGTWTLFTNSGAVPQNHYRLRGIWAVWNATITASNFDDNDIITSSNQTSSATKFFSDTGTSSNVGTPAYEGGFNVPAGGERSIFFRFDSGDVGTTGGVTAHVNVTATITP